MHQSVNQPQFNQYILPINLDSIEFWQWSAEGERAPSQLHMLLSAPEVDVTFVLRFKGPGTLDAIIQQLQEHRRQIWGKEKQAVNIQEYATQFEPETVLLIEIHAAGRVKVGYRWQGREWFPESKSTYPIAQAVEKCYAAYCRREKKYLDEIGRERAKTLDVPELSRIISPINKGSIYAPKEDPRLTPTIALNEMHRRLRTAEPQKVKGPAKIAFLDGKAIRHRHLGPWDTYEGVCLVYDRGIYD